MKESNTLKLKEIRTSIDEIDSKMRELFIERMELVKEVALIKKEENLEVLDSKREEEIIKKHLSSIDDNLKDYYLEFIKEIMKSSKLYQQENLKK